MPPVQDSESVLAALIIPRYRGTYSVHPFDLPPILPGMLSVSKTDSLMSKMSSKTGLHVLKMLSNA